MLSQALALRTHPSYARHRYEIEARLLAGQSPAEIHRSMPSMPDELIACYERLCFNVTDRLADQSYIAHSVFGGRLSTADCEWDLSWKLMGYCGGSKAVDSAIMPMEKADIKSEEELPGFFARSGKKVRQRQSLISTIAHRPETSAEHANYLRLHAKLREIEQQDAANAEPPFLENIRAMLKTLPWCTGSRAPDILPHLKLIRQYSAVPRAHELLRMIEKGPGYIREVLNQPGFPPKVVKTTEQIAKTITMENGEVIHGDVVDPEV
jgi:hypothetical protein